MLETIKEASFGIDSGWSPNCDNKPVNKGKWGILTLSAVSERKYQPEFNKQLLPGYTPRINIEVNKEDLLFSRKNTKELVGATAFVSKTPSKLMLPDTIFRINYDKQKIEGLFFYYVLNSNNFRKTIQNLATGSSGSMPNISKEKLNNVEIPLPPIKLQNHFAEIIKKIETQKQVARESLEKSEELFLSLLWGVFRGDSKNNK